MIFVEHSFSSKLDSGVSCNFYILYTFKLFNLLWRNKIIWKSEKEYNLNVAKQSFKKIFEVWEFLHVVGIINANFQAVSNITIFKVITL